MVEAMVVLAVMAVVASFVILPKLARAGCGCSRISCVNNLKQIGTAMRIWQNDNLNSFPWELPISSGGTKEVALGPDEFTNFVVMQNELGQSARVVVCPDDKERIAATNFTYFGNSNVSYFLGVTVTAGGLNPDLFLSGDRNLSETLLPRHGTFTLSTNGAWGWTPGIHGDKRHPAGNILLQDGRAMVWLTPDVRRALLTPGVTPNTVVFP